MQVALLFQRFTGYRHTDYVALLAPLTVQPRYWLNGIMSLALASA